ncbi:MAG: ribonuclease D [Thermoleophilaceae bacterium]
MVEVHRAQRELLQVERVDPAHIARLARETGAIAVDTEFVSERRYQALLCLVQTAVEGPDGVEIALFDPLDADLDPAPLAEVLADPEVEVVMHAGRQDVALLRRVWGTAVRGLFDTQVAAGFSGYGNQTGYADLVHSLLKVRPRRSEGFTRWDARPLAPEQLEYARADVEHLQAAADTLKERLEASGRLDWAREECRPLESASDERNPDLAYASLPKLGRLNGQQRAVAYELAGWRDEAARRADRPPSTFMPDHVLAETARKMPEDREALKKIRGMPERTVGRNHRDVVAAVERGRHAEPLPFEERRVDTEKADAPLVSLAQALVRQRSMEAEIAVELIATQSDLTRIVASVRSGAELDGGRALEGWRRELVGAELLELLSGRLSARVERGRLRVEPTGS